MEQNLYWTLKANDTHTTPITLDSRILTGPDWQLPDFLYSQSSQVLFWERGNLESGCRKIGL